MYTLIIIIGGHVYFNYYYWMSCSMLCYCYAMPHISALTDGKVTVGECHCWMADCHVACYAMLCHTVGEYHPWMADCHVACYPMLYYATHQCTDRWKGDCGWISPLCAGHQWGRNHSFGSITITLVVLWWMNKIWNITICEILTPVMQRKLRNIFHCIQGVVSVKEIKNTMHW